MDVEKSIPPLEEILATWEAKLGSDLPAYRNHVYRMANFCLALHPCGAEDRKKVAIAGAFHDLGIWSDDTVDYLPPSVARAGNYLEQAGLAPWKEEIGLMIGMHHKLRRFPDPRFPLVEAFRKADLVDVSLGIVKFGLATDFVRAVKDAFPNAGFHKRLGQLAKSWFAKHPVSPPPFLKW